MDTSMGFFELSKLEQRSPSSSPGIEACNIASATKLSLCIGERSRQLAAQKMHLRREAQHAAGLMFSRVYAGTGW